MTNEMLYLPLYVGIILQKNNQVFLVKRTNTNWQSGYWNFPGGLVEKNESIKEAVCREAQEEIGVVILSEDCILSHVLHVHKNESNTRDIVGIYFKAHKWSGIATNNEPSKILDAQWFDMTSLPQNITEHALLALNGLVVNTHYSEHGR